MPNTIKKEFAATSVSVPGETLQELLEERGLSQAELAKRLGLTTKHVNEIIKGKSPITPETAIGLERVLAVSATFWNNRERRYREFVARQEEEQRLTTQLDWVDQFPIKDMQKHGFIDEYESKIAQTQAMLNFLGVASPNQWAVLADSAQVQYRKQTRFESDPIAVSIWLRQAELLGQSINCEPYDEQRLRALLPTLRILTTQEPAGFKPELVQSCASVGVAVTWLPELPRTCLYGAARWLTPSKALVALSLRGKTNDRFWFTFFHELGHILLHGKREVFIDEETGGGSSEEEEADRFARNTLIPEKEYKIFIGPRKKFSPMEIRLFAARVHVHPGIVVGRLQYDKLLPYHSCHDLKRSLKWTHEVEKL